MTTNQRGVGKFGGNIVVYSFFVWFFFLGGGGGEKGRYLSILVLTSELFDVFVNFLFDFFNLVVSPFNEIFGTFNISSLFSDL